MSIINTIFATMLIAVFSASAFSADWHVAKSGSNSSPGDSENPFRTIGRAAEEARAGDRIVVHTGVYREEIDPPRGGTSDSNRITYMAAPGGQVTITGAERITDWVDQGGGVWLATIGDDFFNGYNPYNLTVAIEGVSLEDQWLTYGEWHHRGMVYLNGEGFIERQAVSEVRDEINTWRCSYNSESGLTRIWANFGSQDPNSEMAEINVRESVMFPSEAGLQYITVDGFTLRCAASRWAPPTRLQKGLIGTRMGLGWIIRNCTIAYSRCVGINFGYDSRRNLSDISTFGGHLVSNNHIYRCGQSGINGQWGGANSLISNNLVEDTNHEAEFGGW